MSIDTKRFKDKLNEKSPGINIVPLLDVIFTIMIFLLVMLSQTSMDVPDHYSQDQVSAKPTSSSGTSEYYLIPLNNLQHVTVNGVDYSKYIRGDSIAVHTRVMDEGKIVEKGTHESLLQHNGYYAEMYRKQQEQDEKEG